MIGAIEWKMKSLYRICKKNSAASRELRTSFKLGKIKRICSNFEHVEEYCNNSSVHGFRYFSDKNIHGFERLWCILSFVLSMVGCIMLIRDSYKKWDESPVIVTFSEKMTSIKSIPFPAVTVCPEIKSLKEVFSYKDAMNKLNRKDPPYYGLSRDEFILLSSQLQICDLNNSVLRVRSFGKEITNNDSISDLIKTIAPNMTYSLIGCKFRTVDFDCEDIFQEIVTAEGLCFTLNSLSNEEMFYNGSNYELIGNSEMRGVMGHWTMEDGYEYKETSESSSYPYRVFTSGSNVGLILTLAVREVDMDYVCRGPQQGFKVILHSPNELPDVFQYFRIPVMEDVRMSIKPNIMITSKSLQDYKPERRQCYFNAERTLRYMKSYTQQNCHLECISNLTLEKCGCVRFSMPRDNDTPVCGVAKIECCILMEEEFWKYEDDTRNCNCLPACTSISYDAEISQAKYEFDKYLDAVNEVYPSGLKMSHLSIFFKDNQFVSSKRSELIGMTDFVAACGGLLGLFMGISLLSIVEFVYYFSLRLWCSSRSKNSATEPEETVTHN